VEGAVVEGIGPVSTYFNPTILSVDAVGSGKRSVPVRPTYSLYIFKHVVGVPSRSVEDQVPMNKLRVLDALIDRLVKLRGEKGETLPVSRNNVDSLIERFQGELHGALQATRPLFTGLFPETGLVVDLLA
jgi:hypothetical protein